MALKKVWNEGACYRGVQEQTQGQENQYTMTHREGKKGKRLKADNRPTWRRQQKENKSQQLYAK